MSEDRKPVFLVYAGRTASGNHLYYSLESLKENDGKSCKELSAVKSKKHYAKNLFKSRFIGGIFEAAMSKDGNEVWYNKECLPISGERWKNNADIAEWQLSNRTVALKEKEKRDFQKNRYEKLLEPIREAYLKENYEGKAILLGEVIRIITNK